MAQQRSLAYRIARSYYLTLDYIDARSGRVAMMLVAALGASAIIYYSGDGIESLAPYGFALGKLLAVVVAWEIFDRLRFRGIDFISEVQRGNVAAGLLALCIALLLHAVFGNI